jgi:hypothetical protein
MLGPYCKALIEITVEVNWDATETGETEITDEIEFTLKDRLSRINPNDPCVPHDMNVTEINFNELDIEAP